MQAIQHTLGSYPGLRHADALARALSDTDLAETRHVQLCPQNHGRVDNALDALRAAAPDTQFRLHANCRHSGHRHTFDASDEGPDADAYFRDLAAVSHALGAPAYTLHAGERRGRPISVLHDRMRWMEDCFGIPVGVEGHYPEGDNRWWLSDWAEYRWLLDSGLAYALDLSHLHIVATKSGCIEANLTRELLASERCIEVHLSANDGRSDLHARLSEAPRYWWHDHLDAIQPEATVFYEGNEVRGDRASERVRERIDHHTRRLARRPLQITTKTTGAH